MLTVAEVAKHFKLEPDTIRGRINRGDLHAVRINRNHRVTWQDVWECERGPKPSGSRQDRYKAPLLTKREVASGLRVSVRTVERWIARGLPTRSVFASSRINPHDATDWLKDHLGIDLPDEWWLERNALV